MDEEWIETGIPDLSGMSLEEVRSRPDLDADARRVLEQMTRPPEIHLMYWLMEGH